MPFLDRHFTGLHYLAPAFSAVEDDGAAELDGERELRLEDLAHPRRNVTALQAVESDLADAGGGVGEEGGAEGGN